jgi:hypothetical protein
LQRSLFNRQFPVLHRELLNVLRELLRDASGLFESLRHVAVPLGVQPPADPANGVELMLEDVAANDCRTTLE